MVEALHRNHADPAVPLEAEIRVVAEAGDVDADLLRGVHDCGAFGHQDGFAVDLEADHLGHGSSYTRSMAANLQTSKQFPHLMQAAWSMTWASLREPEMHSTGQLRSQMVQPMHFSALIS